MAVGSALATLLVPAAGAAGHKVPPATPSIVRVTTWNPGGEAGGPAAPANREMTGRAFGFVVETNGLVVTTYRVLLAPGGEELLNDIDVELLVTAPPGSGSAYPASIVAVEPTLNLAVLKFTPDSDLVASVIEDRKKIEEGQAIYAPVDAGAAAGDLQFASGVLSQLNSMECYQESMTAAMYQGQIEISDAGLGAPVFGENGRIVAVHTGYTPRAGEDHVLATDDGLQHLLPVFLVFNIYESLKLRKSLESPWTGFSIRPLNAGEQSWFPSAQRFLGGVAIDHVWPNSPAEELGVREGDVLTRFSYYPVGSPAEFQKWLYMHGVGHAVKLHFLRNRDNYRVLDYVIEARPGWAKPR